MGKKLIITEKPSVARDFARVLNVNRKHTGYIDNDEYIITWCVGHLVEMVYPEVYDPKYKQWKLEDLPFLPRDYKYDVIKNVAEQYRIVHGFLNSPAVDTVYWAGDSGKEGQTIEENIRNFGGVRPGMEERRVWIDSQTDDEIRRGIREAKPMSDYANLGKSGIMRAMEDYALGINFSRALTVKYARMVNKAAATKSYSAIAVGRVMTCVLGMVVDREREIRGFTETPFYRVFGSFTGDGIRAEWHCDEKSKYFHSPALYKENGFRKEEDAKELIRSLNGLPAAVEALEKSRTRKKAPALFNLAELQAECAKQFKISPDETLQAAQTLYERKLTTYPRTDARVLSSAVAKEISKNVAGLKNYPPVSSFAEEILNGGKCAGIEKTPYTDDSKVTDHYAIIPTGQTDGFGGLSDLQKKIYDLIVRRFLSIFYPPAEYSQIKASIRVGNELFTAGGKILEKEGWMAVAGVYGKDGKDSAAAGKASAEVSGAGMPEGDREPEDNEEKPATLEALSRLKKGDILPVNGYEIKEGKTSPPKRYTTGTMILAMENAGNLIEDEELRAQIKNTGIGTSATRAEIIKKLVTIRYLNLNKKTQILTPSRLGEMVYEAVRLTAPSLLNPQMSASWEKGLDEITRGQVRVEDYRAKLEDYIRTGTLAIAGKDLSVELADAIEQSVPEGGDIALPVRSLGISCPACGGELTTTPFGYGCSNYKNDPPCKFSIGKIAGVRLKEEDFRALLENGETRVIGGFRSKSGKPFSAALKLEKSGEELPKVRFVFPERTAAPIPDAVFRETDPYTLQGVSCPICGGPVKKTAGGFACGSHNDDGSGCIFSVGTVCGKRITEGALRELIRDGITSPVSGFVSRDGRAFTARIALKKDEDGKITGMRFVF